MGWSKEKRRAERKRKREEAARLDHQNARAMIALSPPTSELKKPYSRQQLGNNKVDYGGHQWALNFPTLNKELLAQFKKNKGEVQLALKGKAESMNAAPLSDTEMLVTKMGDMSIGLVYDGDWKRDSRIAGKGERDRCLKSE